MTPEDFERVRELFLAARELDTAERADYLDRTCDDSVVRKEVETLLEHQHAPNELLEHPSHLQGLRTELARAFQSTEGEPVPERIGRYAILGALGGGGMGIVYLAEQENPRRKVALKVVRSGGTSPAMLRRFEHEASILGHLDHPGIAHIHEAGVADMQTIDGLSARRPFFAMEYVEGESISEFARCRKLGPSERLTLVAGICDAVHHAHQKGVIHRDLKPGNILVTAEGQSKILDFGVARVTDADIQTVTMQTEVGQLIGTVPYMSPEQFSGISANVDTRSDIYALGVITYELLTGRLPHDVSRMTIPQAARIITDEEPTSLTSVNKDFRGDIDTIVSKALEKDKDRRYQSASDLAADIRRHLSDEPITARPPTTVYQLRKFARRNKALVGGTMATFMALLIGIIGMTVQAATVARQRDAARDAQQLAELRETEAQRQASIAEAINAFLNDDLLASVNPVTARSRDITVLEVLDNAATAIEGKFKDEPVVEAAIRLTLGQTYMSLAKFEQADTHLARSVELRVQELGDDHVDTSKALMIQGYLRIRQGRYDDAEPMFLRSLAVFRHAFGEDHEETLSAKGVLGVLYRRQGRYAEAEPLYLEVLEGRRRVLGEEHRHTLVSMNNLAILYRVQGKIAPAENLYLETLVISRRVHGDDHPDTLNVMNSLAVLYKNESRFEEAERIYLDVIERKKSRLGDEHPETLLTMRNLATLYDFEEKPEQAAELFRRVIEVSRRVLGEEHPDKLAAETGLAYAYYSLEQWDNATALATATLATQRRLLGQKNGDTLSTMRLLAKVHAAQGRHEDAVDLFSEVFDVRRRTLGEDHRVTLGALSQLVTSLVALERFEEAEPLAIKSREAHLRMHGPDHEKTKEAVDTLVQLYEGWGKPDKAAEFRAPATEATQPAGTTSSTSDKATAAG